MPAYHFTAINLLGKEEKGVLEAESEKHARQLIRAKNLAPLQVKASYEKNASQSKPSWQSLTQAKGLSSKEVALFTRQFATLLVAGLPIEECLQATAEQTEKSRLKALILSVRAKVMEGHALASALGDYPQAFSNLFCSTVAAGEKSGHLDKVLVRLADYTEQQWQMQQKLKTALIYPSMIVLVAFGIVGFLLSYVVPKMVSVYSHLGQSLPLVTTILITISNVVKSYGLYGLLLLALAIWLWRRAVASNTVLRTRYHYFLLRLPFLGGAIKTVETARFARTLSILTASGVPALEAMTISVQLVDNIPIREAIRLAVSRVSEGATINLALKQTTYFSPMSIHMIASGEASGQLETMLERVANHQEEEISRLIEVGLALFEPIIILLMGLVVLFIVLAVLLPIFQINQFAG